MELPKGVEPNPIGDRRSAYDLSHQKHPHRHCNDGGCHSAAMRSIEPGIHLASVVSRTSDSLAVISGAPEGRTTMCTCTSENLAPQSRDSGFAAGAAPRNDGMKG